MKATYPIHDINYGKILSFKIIDSILSVVLGYYVCFFSIDWYSNQWGLLLKTLAGLRIIKAISRLFKNDIKANS